MAAALIGLAKLSGPRLYLRKFVTHGTVFEQRQRRKRQSHDQKSDCEREAARVEI
jgi:hypothetical protein